MVFEKQLKALRLRRTRIQAAIAALEPLADAKPYSSGMNVLASTRGKQPCAAPGKVLQFRKI